VGDELDGGFTEKIHGFSPKTSRQQGILPDRKARMGDTTAPLFYQGFRGLGLEIRSFYASPF
jgi:hypothetical protein